MKKYRVDRIGNSQLSSLFYEKWACDIDKWPITVHENQYLFMVSDYGKGEGIREGLKLRGRKRTIKKSLISML